MTERRSKASQSKAEPRPADEIDISLQSLGQCGDFGALAHYADPAYYSQCYRSRKQDVNYYVRLARKQTGNILEYGCGNGRVTIAMAQAGARVWGIDLSKPMLNDLEQYLSQAYPKLGERITLLHGDMRLLELEQRFSLILAPFNVMLHLYTRQDIELFLQNVKRHLLPGGQFVCDVSVPQISDLARSPHKHYKAPSFLHPVTLQKIGYAERFEYDPIRQLLLVWMEFQPEDGSQPWTVPLTHRQYFPCELEAYFGHAGFASVEWTADFSDNPPDAATDSLVITCRV